MSARDGFAPEGGERAALTAALDQMEGLPAADGEADSGEMSDLTALTRLVEERISDMTAWRERGRA